MLSKVQDVIEYHSLTRRLEKQNDRKLTDIERKVVINHITKESLIRKHFKNVKRVYYFALHDFLNLYKQSDIINYANLKEHIKPYFGFIFKHIYEDSSKKFGYLIRKKLFKKTDFKTKQVTFRSQEQDINNRYDTYITDSFSALGSDHINLVTDTIIKDIEYYIHKSNEDYVEQVRETKKKIDKLSAAISAALFLKHQRQKELKRQKEVLQAQLINLQQEKEKIIRSNLKTSLKSRFDSRAKTTTFQEVGTSQSMSQNIEAQSISQQPGIVASGIFGGQSYAKLLTKVWSSILDRKTRVAHAYADGQTQNVSDSFYVGGEALRFPRDPNGSSENTINCRCDLVYVLERNSI